VSKASRDDVRRIWSTFSLDRNAARAMYAERFGRVVDDPSIDAELSALFSERSNDSETVAVPAHLLLALAIRPPPGKGRGKKKPPLETWKKRFRAQAVRRAESEWARQVAEHGPKVSKRAKHAAAKNEHKNVYGHGIKTVAALEKMMSLARGMRTIAKK
jgi:hypothetical protein